jgi:hypothetical protein
LEVEMHKSSENIELTSVIRKLKNLGFSMENSQIFFYHSKENIYYFAGLENKLTESLVPLSALDNRLLTLKCKRN